MHYMNASEALFHTCVRGQHPAARSGNKYFARRTRIPGGDVSAFPWQSIHHVYEHTQRR